MINPKLRWEVSTGEPKVTQRNRQTNRGTGRKVRVRGGEDKVNNFLSPLSFLKIFTFSLFRFFEQFNGILRHSLATFEG